MLDMLTVFWYTMSEEREMINMKTLEVRYDSRKSFYGKAHTLEESGVTYLISYATRVAKIENNELEIFGTYSPTTLRHIKEFVLQNGFQSGTKSELEDMYIK